jgi:hypothetical protein
MAHPFIPVVVPEGDSTVNTDYIIAFLRGSDDGGPPRHKLILRTGLELFVHEDYDEVQARIFAAAEAVRD